MIREEKTYLKNWAPYLICEEISGQSKQVYDDPNLQFFTLPMFVKRSKHVFKELLSKHFLKNKMRYIFKKLSKKKNVFIFLCGG